MKKNIYTIAFIAFFSSLSQAQTTSTKEAPATKQTSSTELRKKEPAKVEAINPDGTTTTAPAGETLQPDNKETTTTKQQSADSKSTEVKPAGGTRMAITEKGVPASKKAAEPKKAEPAKTEKH